MKIDNRQAILEHCAKENKVIDIFVDDKGEWTSYLSRAKKVEEQQDDLCFSMTQYTPQGSEEVKVVIPSEKIRERRIRQRQELFEQFMGNKFFDEQLVEKMLSFDKESCVINLNLSLSNIADEGFYEGRLAYVYNQIVIDLKGSESEAKKSVDNALKMVDEIVDYAKNGYTLRFWCCYNNESLCSLYYLMNILRGIDCPIILLSLPRKIRKENGRYLNKLRSWGQVCIEQMGFAISQSNPHLITKDEKEEYALVWDKLKEEDAKLRITTDKGIRSVPVDYYFDMIEEKCPRGKRFRLIKLLSSIYKEVKRFDLDLFPYYFWSTQFYIMIEKGILRKIKPIHSIWGFDYWVEYVENRDKSFSGVTRDELYYVDSRLEEIGINPMERWEVICGEDFEKSYKVLRDNPNITKEEFLSIMGIEEDAFDEADHNLRIYKYSYCSKCGQLVDKRDYSERKYCRYCEAPNEETLNIINEIYEKAKWVMNYLLKINLNDEIIKLAIADKNLDKSYRIIKNNEGIEAEEFIEKFKMVGYL